MCVLKKLTLVLLIFTGLLCAAYAWAKDAAVYPDRLVAQIGEIDSKLKELVSDGLIKGKQIEKLTKKLELAENRLEQNKIKAARGLLQSVDRRLRVIMRQPMVSLEKKAIPIRFVEGHDCYPFIQGCDPHIDRELLIAEIDALNGSFASAGLEFWIKSVERYYFQNFANEYWDESEKFYWEQARDELDPVFDFDQFGNFPYPDVPKGPIEDDPGKGWIEWASTIFSDPTELLIWIFNPQSLTNRLMNQKSFSTYPVRGRYSVIGALNIYNPDNPTNNDQPEFSPYHLSHELGHFFGVRHPHQSPVADAQHPTENRTIAWHDLWDLIYCTDDQGVPFFFSSAEDVKAHSCDFKTIWNEHNCSINNITGGDSIMQCTVEGHSFQSGDSALKGLSFNLGQPDNWPDSFAWGLNHMGYYSRFRAHYYTPGRFPASQNILIRGHAANSVPIAAQEDYSPYSNLMSRRDELGTLVDDFIWWANGDLTFAREKKPISIRQYRPFSGDFDGNGVDDIFWYQPGTGSDYLWWANGDRTWVDDPSYTVDNYYTPVSGDFNGNGTTDIIWYRPGAEVDFSWWFNPQTGTYTERVYNISGHYTPISGDFDGDGDEDIVWYNVASGFANIWWANPSNQAAPVGFYPVNGLWVGKDFVPVAGDFDGDEKDDIFWYRAGIGDDVIWWGPDTILGWEIDERDDIQVNWYYTPVSGDFDGDGCADIIWDVKGHIKDYLWTGNESRTFGKTRTMIHPAFTAVVGRFDDMKGHDIFWYDAKR